MHIRWFGEPWEGAVCEPEYQIEVPVGTKCLECSRIIGERDRGVVTGCSSNIWGSWKIEVNGNKLTACSYHLSCFLEIVVGGVLPAKMLSRMSDRSMADPGEPPPVDNDVIYEDVEPGRGWGARTRDT